MFGRDEADRLRDSLSPIGLNSKINETTETPLLVAYLDYYDLNFNSDDIVSGHYVGFINSGEFKLVCHYFTVPMKQRKGTAFLLHGYFDHTGLYSHLIRYCLQLGYAVVIFDLPGHGLSSGPTADIGSFRQYSEAFLNVLVWAKGFGASRPWIVIGQSTGAAIIMDALQDTNLADQFSVERYILLGPFLRPKGWIVSKLLFSLTRWFMGSAPRNFATNSHDEEFLKFVRSSDALQSRKLSRSWVLAMIEYQKRFTKAAISNKILHIIQGSGDETVDWQYNLSRILHKFPDSKIYMITGARHHLVNESPEFRDKILFSIGQIIRDTG